MLGGRQHIALTGMGSLSLVHMSVWHAFCDELEVLIRCVIEKIPSMSYVDAP